MSTFTVARPSIQDPTESKRQLTTSMTNAVFRFVRHRSTGFTRESLINNILQDRGFMVQEESVMRALRKLRERDDVDYSFDTTDSRYAVYAVND